MEISSKTVEGTCQQMCSRKEMIMRENERLLHPLEMLTICDDNLSTNSRCLKADPSRVVKQFSRPAAGRAEADPSDLRPAPVLRETVTYLFESILPRDNPAWSSIYEFVFDRLRAVRQDMVIQGISGSDAICLLEQIVRFHVYASYRLRDSAVTVFDPVINKQHLLECLKRLLYLYQVMPGRHVNQPEFESVYLLSNLGDTHALTHFLDLKPDVRKHLLIQQCYEISQAYVSRNYTRALKLISQLPCAMCLCAVNPHRNTLQINYLQILSAGYSVKNCRFPVSQLRRLLQLQSDDETLTLCSRCGLTDLFDNTSTDSICFNRAAFSYPKQSETPAALPELDRILKQTSISSLLLGKTPGGMGVKDTERTPKTIGRGQGRGRRQQQNN
ncbi:hypothetical protein BsWGS_17161 [Bradybaena similaris]